MADEKVVVVVVVVDDDDYDDDEDDDVESEEDDDVEEDDVEEEDRSQDRDPHFAGACAVEMHADISPEPLYTEICKKNARPRLSPKRRHTHTQTLCASLRGRNAGQDLTRATYTEIYR